MSSRKLTRRSFLRGLAGGAAVTVALPVFEALLNEHGTAFATGESLPKRFGLFFWGNGILPAKWVPAQTGTGYTLSEQLAGLANVKSLVTVVTGLEVKVVNNDPHGAGSAGILSGAALSISGEHKTFIQPTIDQVIAKQMGTATPFRSIEFGASPGAGHSYNGPDNQNPPESSPKAMFDRLFGGVQPGTAGTVDPRLALRRSVLDSVLEDAALLKKRLGKSDQVRLDQHLTGVRELERRIVLMENNASNLAACAIPVRPESDYPDVNGRPQLSAKNRVMTDLIAMALACDQTRVFSNFFTYSVNNLLFPDAPSGHHQLTHDEGGDQPQVNAIVKQIVVEYAYVVEKLQSVAEGAGTLLDNCIVLGTTDCSYGRTHSLDEFPILLAGSAGGRIKQGIHFRATPGENASKVHLSILHALDIAAASYGTDTAQVTSGLSGIEI